MNINYDTIIVGSGISGLYSNYKLNPNKNKKILIIEGSNKSGGRIESLNQQFSYSKHIIETGAHRISSKHNWF